MDANELPPCVMDLAKQILPDFIHLFTGLKKARALREEDAEEDEDEAEIDDEEEELSELEDDQFRVLIENWVSRIGSLVGKYYRF